jgi:hypothetical protein
LDCLRLPRQDKAGAKKVGQGNGSIEYIVFERSEAIGLLSGHPAILHPVTQGYDQAHQGSLPDVEHSLTQCDGHVTFGPPHHKIERSAA